MKTLMILTALLSSVSALAADQVKWGSAYTNLKKECVEFASATEKSPIDFYGADCKSFGGYRLQWSGGDIRYAPVLSFNGADLEMGRPGAFHDLGSDNVEWMYKTAQNEEGIGEIEWKGFIYRLSVANEDGMSNKSILYAVRLDGANSCFLGNPKNNEEARALVKNASAPCVSSNN
jgi:hypothetical protein